jgi:cytidyltransferase-like protein
MHCRVVRLEILDKTLLTSIYVSALDGRSVFERAKELAPFTDEVLSEHVDSLRSLGMVNNEMRLTEIGRDALKVVFAGGVFDIIHPGHIHTLRSAKALGDILVVSIARNTNVVKTKGTPPMHDEKLRQELVSSLKFVDLALLGNEDDIFKTVELVRPNIIALGYDQVHQEKHIVEECKKRNLNVQVVRLQSPVPDLKSSSIKKDLGESLYKI